MNRIYYFDYNATHPPFSEILQQELVSYSENYCNPSGPTRFSLKQQGRIEEVRSYFSSLSNKPETGLVFSSTGTEAIHFLVYAVSRAWEKQKKDKFAIVSPYEHPALYASLDSFGFSYEILQGDKSGLVSEEAFAKSVKNHPRSAVFLIYAANETGVIQNIRELAPIAKHYDCWVFSDLIQAFGKTNIAYEHLDGFVLSGHKIGAGMGVSLSYLDQRLMPRSGFFRGGNQENSLRAGSENVFAISCLQRVAQLQLQGLPEKEQRLQNWQNQIEHTSEKWGVEIIASGSPRLVSTTYSLFPLEEIDFLMLGLEEKGIIVSNGSSCKSRSREASPGLVRMGYSEEEALRAIRISTGYFTTAEEIDFLLENLRIILQALQ
ncbi:MAG: aminotransferase class V-fold PLP-dependent enzyme [Spirochaetota bacterium]